MNLYDHGSPPDGCVADPEDAPVRELQIMASDLAHSKVLAAAVKESCSDVNIQFPTPSDNARYGVGIMAVSFTYDPRDKDGEVYLKMERALQDVRLAILSSAVMGACNAL